MIQNTGLELIEGVYIKHEATQPTGSIKFRPAMSMIADLIGHTSSPYPFHILESSSGNTAVAVAQICFMLNIPCTIVIPEFTRSAVFEELERYKANVVISPAEYGSDGAKDWVRNVMYESPGKYSYLNQYSNKMNPRAHYLTTGPEVWRQTKGDVTHVILGIGTGGTITGIGKYLKEQNPEIQIIGVQPSDWIGISGLRNIETSFVPKVLDTNIIDDYEFVDTLKAARVYDELWEEYGCSAGYSSAANFSVAREIAQSNPEAIVLTIFPDDRRRYE